VIAKFKTLTNTENKRRLISNFMSLTVLRGFQFLIPLITLPYLVRTIGIENFGLVNFALSLGLYFGAIIQFGFSITATREIARHRDDSAKLVQIYSATLTASILLALASAILFTLIVFLFDKFNSHLNLYLFTLVFVVFQNLFPIWFFQGMEKMKYITFLTLGTNLIFLVSLFVFVKQEDDFVLVPLLNATAAFITFVIAIALINKQFKVSFTTPGIQEIKSIYQNGHHAFISQLAPNFYNNSAVFFLGLFSNNLLVGVYAAATKVIDAIISFAYIISNTFLPYLSRNLKIHKVFEKIMLLSGLILTLVTFVMAEWITELLYSADNIEVSLYIQWLSIAIFFGFGYLTYSTNYLMISGQEKVAKNISLYVSSVAFFWTILLTYLYGIEGAVISVLIARAALSFFSFIYYKRCQN
jgi:polysaccharide transporter, PST family